MRSKTPTPDAAAKLAMWWNELSYDDQYPQKLERRIRRAIAAAVKAAVIAERERNSDYVGRMSREYMTAYVAKPDRTSRNDDVSKHLAAMSITIAKGEA